MQLCKNSLEEIGMAITTFAAINVGSHETSLCVYEVSKKNGIRKLDYIYQPVPLGTQSYSDGKIQNATVKLLCDTLLQFKLKMKEYDVQDYTALATSALREASNNIIVLEQIKLRTGLQVKILSNSEQRFLCYKAIALKENAFHKLIQKGTAIVDIGGGNIQISVYNKEHLIITQSFRLGPLRILEKLENLEYYTDSYEALLTEYAANDIHTFCKQYLSDMKIKNIIAVGNHLHYFSGYLSRYCKEIVDPIDSKGKKKDAITKKEFHEFYESIKGHSTDHIADTLNIPLEEAALVLPTTMLYHTFFAETGAELMWLSGITLSDGMVAEYAQIKEKIIPAHNFKEDIVSCSRTIANRFHSNTTHTSFIQDIASRMFDSLKKRYSLSERDCLLLQIACVLHDCGAFININQIRENSYKIIMSTEMIGLSHKEREIIGHIIRYEGTFFPEYSDVCEIFDLEDYMRTAKLAAIFRLANALDKSHKQKINHVSIVTQDANLLVTCYSLYDITIEQRTFTLYNSFFEEVFGLHATIKYNKSARYSK